MPYKRLLMCFHRRVPDLDSAIWRRRCEEFTIMRECDRVNHTPMALESLQTVALWHFPDLPSVIERSRCKKSIIARKGYRCDGAAMAVEHSDAVVCCCIP